MDDEMKCHYCQSIETVRCSDCKEKMICDECGYWHMQGYAFCPDCCPYE